jgi:hypothetical protein
MDVENLKQEREKVKAALREVEAEARRLDLETKGIRQREIQAKREIDALSVLIEIAELRQAAPAAEQ